MYIKKSLPILSKLKYSSWMCSDLDGYEIDNLSLQINATFLNKAMDYFLNRIARECRDIHTKVSGIFCQIIYLLEMNSPTP